MDDPYSQVPDSTEWCPQCNAYGSSLTEETERCTRCGGSGLVLVAHPGEGGPDGDAPARPGTTD
jgi:hypothetical protein